MFFTRILISLFEFLLAVLMSGFIIYITYRVFIHANPDFDMEDEIRKGNTAVGALVASILFAASMILQKGMDSVVSIFRLHMTTPGASSGFSVWQLGAIALGHLTMSLVLALLTVSITLRLFGKLTSNLQEGKELQRGNLAVGILLSSVVLVSAMFVGEGVSALSKALVPQPSIGRIQIMR